MQEYVQKFTHVTRANVQCARQCKGFSVDNRLDEVEDTQEVSGQSQTSTVLH